MSLAAIFNKYGVSTVKKGHRIISYPELEQIIKAYLKERNKPFLEITALKNPEDILSYFNLTK